MPHVQIDTNRNATTERLIGERSRIVLFKGLNMEDSNHLNVPAVSEITFSSDDLEALRRVEILGQRALPASPYCRPFTLTTLHQVSEKDAFKTFCPIRWAGDLWPSSLHQL